MRAVLFDGTRVRVGEHPAPTPPAGWARLRPLLAGVCRTDIEITRGYMSHRGVLGHEFVGLVESCEGRPELVGRRVVGDINAACGSCEVCRSSDGHHCPQRTVLGIDGLDGCMAEQMILPARNLCPVPDDVTDDRAVFAEPLAAAFEIAEQLEPCGDERCVVLGDGKLGILCAWALSSAGLRVTLVGRHEDKLAIARALPTETTTDAGGLERADIVVEATGRSAGLEQAVSLCRPRGTVVMKSTIADAVAAPLMQIVVDEIRLVGSRCGPMPRAIAALSEHQLPVERLIAERFPLEEGERALARACEPGMLKVAIEVGAPA